MWKCIHCGKTWWTSSCPSVCDECNHADIFSYYDYYGEEEE